jgi:leucyl aminopeptidase
MINEPPKAQPAAVTPADVLCEAGAADAVPVHLVAEGEGDALGDAAGDVAAGAPGAGAATRRWLAATRFTAAAKKQALVPTADGSLGAVMLGAGNGRCGEPSGASDLLAGQLAQTLPPGTYRLQSGFCDPRLAAVAWGLGAYRFRRYKSGNGDTAPALALPEGVDRAGILSEVEAVWLGRDLINTPASDLGPAELEAAARTLAARHGASCTVVVGDALLEQNFPLIHAVGRASSRAPRLIDLRWGRADAPRVTLVGKGITFDTGGLDIKPSSGMLLMKKDMGGAAVALALGHMIMAARCDVALRILIPAAENSIAGDAFRPSDVIRSRDGRTVEIGNTDAEGRLVLADAISYAEEAAPADGAGTMLVFATLTGAARVALGPDLPALFTDDDALAAALVRTGNEIGDPVWRMPLWPGYERHLDSEIADMNNVYDAPFAGAVTAALFLRRFARRTRRFAHFDLYGWRPAARPLGPKGGEPQTARTLFAVLAQECGR